jgi:hypothetical protein
MVEIPRLQAKRKFVMPAKAGIQANAALNKPGFRPKPE